jgi:predicted metal-dependent HD superfamily phosphohydrolase
MQAMNTTVPAPAASPAAWRHLLQRAGADMALAAALLAQLQAHYAAPGRAYHHLGHVGHVLYVVAALAGHCPQPVAVRLAAWFHDAIYVPGAGDNEARSAKLAEDWIARLQLPLSLCDEVPRLIGLTTGHDAPASDANGAVLLDADLAVLGLPPALYDAYARAIRREYAHIGDGAYRAGRTQVLRRFLARDTLFRTAPMVARYETRARLNLAREIDALRAER